MNALVTGCAGFIGSHLSDALLQDGHTVIGVDCYNENYSREDKLRNLEQARQWDAFNFRRLDLASADTDTLVADADIVFHLAGEPGVRTSWGTRFGAYLRNNVLATQRLLEAARAHPEKRVVLASSSSIYGQAERFPTPESTVPQPLSPYGTTKLCAEHLCQLYAKNYGVSTVILRYFSVFGPRQRPDMAFSIFSRSIIRDDPIRIFGSGKQTRDFTFVTDVVSATLAASFSTTALGGTYNVGGGSQVALIDALSILGSIAGQEPRVEYLEAEHGDVRDTRADITLASQHLDYSPRITVEEGLEAQLDWTRAVEHIES
jgi:nucleoside-diphosphate-sugar epimerase